MPSSSTTTKDTSSQPSPLHHPSQDWEEGPGKVDALPFTGPPAGPTLYALKTSVHDGSRSTLSYFRLVWNDTIMGIILNATNASTPALSLPFPAIDFAELWIFLAFLLARGTHGGPSDFEMQWEDDWSLPILKETGMSRKRFFNILGRLSGADDTIDINDPVRRIRAVLDELNAVLPKLWNPGHAISFDEVMVKFKGRVKFKQFNPAKPIKRGFKLHSTCATNGFPLQLGVYVGAKSLPDELESGYNLQNGHLRQLLDRMPHLFHCGHEIFCDNLYTTFEVLEALLKDGFRATGTLRHRRDLPPPFYTLGTNSKNQPAWKFNPFEKVAKSKKLQRGDSLYWHKGPVNAVLWQDTKPTLLMTTNTAYDGHGRLSTKVQRTLKDADKVVRAKVPSPIIVQRYNQHMGGVDLLGQHVQAHGLNMKSKHSYRRLLYFFLDLSVVSSFIIANHVEPDLYPNQLVYRKLLIRDVITHFLSGRTPRTPLSIGPTCSVPTHTPEVGERRQCIVCKKRTRTSCDCCCQNIHVGDCWRIYHDAP